MSCNDVCIDQSWAADGNCEFYTDKIVTARRAHRCVECSQRINVGQRYERASGRYDGDFFSDATCLLCADVRKSFVCGSWVLGLLWESVEEELFPRWRDEGPFECMAKLQTQEARDYCLTRYEEWAKERAA